MSDVPSHPASDTDDESVNSIGTNTTSRFVFRCRPKKAGKSSVVEDSQLFVIDTIGVNPYVINAEGEKHQDKTSGTNSNESITGKSKKIPYRLAKLIRPPPVASEIFVRDDSKIKKLMEKAVIQPGFDSFSVEEAGLKSKTRLRKERRIERSKTLGKAWNDMREAELTEEHRRDLEFLQMRRSLDPKSHYRRADRETVSKFFEVGRVIETKADYYSSRMTRRERKKTMVEELMADHEMLAKNKRRYDEIMRRKSMTRRGAYQHKGFLPKTSKYKNKVGKGRAISGGSSRKE